jgi:transposase
MRPKSGPFKGLTRVVGVDVGKAQVVIFDSLSRRTRRIDNDPEALTAALAPFADYELMVCEATGGYERALLEAAARLGLPAHRADALRVKRYIASLGGAAKTDDIDAAWLTRYGEERGAELARWTPATAEEDELACLVRHRRRLVDARTETKNRRAAPLCGPIAAILDDEIAFFAEQIRRIDAAIAELTARQQRIAERLRRLRRLTGFGPVVATTLVALMPELGALSRRQAAALAGLAPHPNDSGKRSGRRRTGPGRSDLKPLLFMAALAAVKNDPRCRDFADRLALAGKPKRLILTAVARRLIVIANSELRQPALT